MALEHFIPEIWTAALETEYAANQVVIPTFETSFEGEAAKGNTVHIIGAITPTIVDYKAQGRTVTPEELDDTNIDLLIDQERAWAIDVDDVDAAQAAGSLEPYSASAGQALAEEAETFVIGKLIDEGTDVNTAGATVTTAAQAKAVLRKLRTELTKAKVPTSGRYAAVNPAFADLVLESLSDAAAAGSDGELRTGVIGRLYGLTILESPHFTVDVPAAVGYHAKAAAFVPQVDKVEALRNPAKFADIVRGLSVYGSKVTRPAGVVVYVSGGIVTEADESGSPAE